VGVLGLAVLMVVMAVLAVLFGVAVPSMVLLLVGLMAVAVVPFVLVSAAVVAVFVMALVLVAVVVLVVVSGISSDEALWQELHAALGTAVGLVALHLRMHRADVCHLFSGLCEQLHPARRATAGLSAHDL
jgi:hypothetical protein